MLTVEERPVVLCAFLEMELCRQAQEEAREVESQTAGLGTWGPRVLFTCKFTYKSPVPAPIPFWNTVVDELMQQELIYYLPTRCLFNVLRTQRWTSWQTRDLSSQSSHSSGGAKQETSKWLDRVHAKVTHVQKQANVVLCVKEGRGWRKGTLERMARWHGSWGFIGEKEPAMWRARGKVSQADGTGSEEAPCQGKRTLLKR